MSKSAQTEEPYRVADVAKLLGCSVQQVRTLFHAGTIPGGFQVGKLIRFERDEVDRWLSERKAAGKKAGGG